MPRANIKPTKVKRTISSKIGIDPLFYGFSKNTRSFAIPSMRIERYMDVLSYSRALACPTRLHILRVIGANGMSVSDVASSMGLVTSTVCFHLNELMKVGLVTKRRSGRNVVYRWSLTRLSITVEQVATALSSTTA